MCTETNSNQINQITGCVYKLVAQEVESFEYPYPCRRSLPIGISHHSYLQCAYRMTLGPAGWQWELQQSKKTREHCPEDGSQGSGVVRTFFHRSLSAMRNAPTWLSGSGAGADFLPRVLYVVRRSEAWNSHSLTAHHFLPANWAERCAS